MVNNFNYYDVLNNSIPKEKIANNALELVKTNDGKEYYNLFVQLIKLSRTTGVNYLEREVNNINNGTIDMTFYYDLFYELMRNFNYHGVKNAISVLIYGNKLELCSYHISLLRKKLVVAQKCFFNDNEKVLCNGNENLMQYGDAIANVIKEGKELILADDIDDEEYEFLDIYCVAKYNIRTRKFNDGGVLFKPINNSSLNREKREVLMDRINELYELALNENKADPEFFKIAGQCAVVNPIIRDDVMYKLARVYHVIGDEKMAYMYMRLYYYGASKRGPIFDPMVKEILNNGERLYNRSDFSVKDKETSKLSINQIDSFAELIVFHSFDYDELMDYYKVSKEDKSLVQVEMAKYYYFAGLNKLAEKKLKEIEHDENKTKTVKNAIDSLRKEKTLLIKRYQLTNH